MIQRDFPRDEHVLISVTASTFLVPQLSGTSCTAPCTSVFHRTANPRDSQEVFEVFTQREINPMRGARCEGLTEHDVKFPFHLENLPLVFSCFARAVEVLHVDVVSHGFP